MGVKKCCEVLCCKGLRGVGSMLIRYWFDIGCSEVGGFCG